MGHAVILNNASVHSLVVGDDREDRVLLHLWAVHGCVVLHVPLALLLDHPFGQRKLYFSIEHSSFVIRALSRIVALEGGNLLPEELRLFRARMGNERFGLGEFQLEVFVEEHPNLAFELFGFLFGANKS